MSSSTNSALQDAKRSNCLAATILSWLPSPHWYHETDRCVEVNPHNVMLFGFMNPLRGTALQLVDQVAIEWLYGQSDSALRNSPVFDASQCVAIILCGGLQPNPNIIEICRQNDIGLVRSHAPAVSVLDVLQANLPPLLSPRCNKHGVFLAVMNTGVLITGQSGVGKSEVALDLVQRGHQLVADDAVDIYRRDGAELMGECSPMLKGYLEIRGLGIINIEKMFGPAAVLDRYRLQLIINLRDAPNSEIRRLDRLLPSIENVEILGVEVPCLNMLVAPGRNLSVLVEAAIRDHLLRLSGVDSSLEFISRHDHVMEMLEQQNAVQRNEVGP